MNTLVLNQANIYFGLKRDEAYARGFNDSLSALDGFLTKQQKKCLSKDLQIDGAAFNEVKYLQAACETSITGYLAKKFPDTFRYEPKVNPPKDVDCSFAIDGIAFNLEIKCADFSKKNDIDSSNAFKLGSIGRQEDLAEFEELIASLRKVFESQDNPEVEPNKPLIIQQHMDNKLKEFLLSAHSKFNDVTGPNELNVLVVCCSDPYDMQKWFSYLYANQGLFTDESFHPNIEYCNVDIVILSNLYHRHQEYWKKDKIQNHWDFSEAFNLICNNPYRREDKKNLIDTLVDNIPNFSEELYHYRTQSGLEELRIPHFVYETLFADGRYYFQPQAISTVTE